MGGALPCQPLGSCPLAKRGVTGRPSRCIFLTTIGTKHGLPVSSRWERQQTKGDMSGRHYRQRAASCHLMAEELSDPGQRLKLLQLAEIFLRLADRFERSDKLTQDAEPVNNKTERLC